MHAIAGWGHTLPPFYDGSCPFIGKLKTAHLVICSFQASLCPSEATPPCPQPSLYRPADHDLKHVLLACKLTAFAYSACEWLIQQDLRLKL